MLFRRTKLDEIVTWIDLDKAERVADNDQKIRKSGSQRGRERGDARQPHSIRLSDSEWNLIERAAARHGVPAGELVRAGATALAEDRLGEAPPATVSPGRLALIETMWRMVHVLGALNRDDLLADGRSKELDDIVAAAHRTMNETMSEGPGRGIS